MKKKRSFIKYLFYFTLFFSVLWGSQAWFTWWIGGEGTIYRVFLLIMFGIAFLYKLRTNNKIKKGSNVVLLVIIYLLGVAVSGVPGITFVVGTLLKLYPLVVLFSMSREDQCEALSFISKGLALLFIPGFIIYGIVQATEIPGFPLINDGKLFYIYGFDIRDMSDDVLGNFHRFHSVFLEPGYLGVLTAFVLYANRFDLKKWYIKIILLGLLASFSLGGYVVAIMSYGLFLVSKRQFNIKPLLISVIVLFSCFVLAKTINDGDNLLNNLIVERLKISDDGKGIEGNNRFSEGTDYYYDLYKSELLFGIGAEKIERVSGGTYETSISGAGYKVYFLYFGIMSALFFFLFYAILGSSVSCNKRYSFFFLIIIIVTFIFQADLTSPSWYIVYFLGCASCEPLVVKRNNQKTIPEVI